MQFPPSKGKFYNLNASPVTVSLTRNVKRNMNFLCSFRIKFYDLIMSKYLIKLNSFFLFRVFPRATGFSIFLVAIEMKHQKQRLTENLLCKLKV